MKSRGVAVVVAGWAVLSCSAPTQTDCTATQGWSDGNLDELSRVEVPFEPLVPQGFGMTARFGIPATRAADGGEVPSIVLGAEPLRFPASVESVGLDGGPASFQFHALVDGAPWPAEFSQDGGVVARPAPDKSGVANFEVTIAPPTSPGAHDVILVTIREAPSLALGGALTWLVNSTSLQGALGPSVPVVEVPRSGNGSGLRAPNGTWVLWPAVFVPDAGAFAWTAHLEEESEEARTSCVGSVRRYRLVAFLDGAPWRFAGNEAHLDVDIQVGAAAEAAVSFTGLPNDGGHVLTVLMQQNPGRYQVRPDGTPSPWFNMLVSELGTARW